MIGPNAWPSTAPRPPKDQILGGLAHAAAPLFGTDDQQAGRAAGPDPLVRTPSQAGPRRAASTSTTGHPDTAQSGSQGGR